MSNLLPREEFPPGMDRGDFVPLSVMEFRRAYTTHSPHFVSVPDYADVILTRRDGEGTYVHQSSLAFDAKRKEKLLKELDP
jgi:putative ATP-dependent endonuclease of the OLD family